MLCTSILSEVVLGFMLWTGLLGPTNPHATEAGHAAAPGREMACDGDWACCPPLGIGYACPQACVKCPVPVCGPHGAAPCYPATASVEVHAIHALPSHLTCRDLASPSLRTRITEQTPRGLTVEISLQATKGGVKEVYTGRHCLPFNSPTSVVLSGGQPEPVCLQVVARPESWPLPAPVAMPGMPMPYCGMPMPVETGRIPDPIPLFPPMFQQPIIPVSLSTAAPTPVRRTSVRLVYESGKARLSVKSEGMTTECMRMKLETGAAGAVRMAAGKKHVHISGTKWKAEADRLELGDDGRIVLVGHVKLLSDKLGVCAAVRADRMCVQVKAGKFEKIVDPK